jgi:magnesium-transporting ATPase (P-type)
MNTQQNMEERLWEYIDGSSSLEEKTAIEKLLEANLQWKEKYHELLELHQLVQSSAIEEPSMRFTKNVMEEIAKHHIAAATKTYINKKVIWGIASFFFIIILAMLAYGFGQMDWSSGSNHSELPFDVPKIDLSKFFNNNYLNVFLMISVVFGLFVLDRFLSERKKSFHKNA